MIKKQLIEICNKEGFSKLSIIKLKKKILSLKHSEAKIKIAIGRIKNNVDEKSFIKLNKIFKK